MLVDLLVKAGLVTGPLPTTFQDGKLSNTSNSSLGMAKTFLLGQAQFAGDETYLIFGRVLHEHLQFIENEKFRSKDFGSLTKEEQSWVLGCCKAARENPVVRRLLVKTTRENKVYTEIDGIRVALILDLEQSNTDTGADWKSTSCASLNDFIKKALDYDYIRQGLLYKGARNLKHFYFIGLQKRPPHNVYIMDVKRHEAEEFYAKQELKFLLYFYRHYGKVVLNKQTQQIMESGKEALKAIKEHYKKVKESSKNHERLVAQHNKMINKFPKKERPLYSVELEKLSQVE
jgi:hypothetical protein